MDTGKNILEQVADVKDDEKESKESQKESIQQDSPIFRLNEDCLRHIFSFLSFKERVKIQEVCKEWQVVSKLPWTDINTLKVEFFYSVEKNGEKIKRTNLEHILNFCGSSLIEIDLTNFHHTISKDLLELIDKKCPNLRCIDLKNGQFTHESAEYFSENFNNCTVVGLPHSWERFESSIFKFFSNNKRLHTVKINCTFDSNESLLGLHAENIKTFIVDNAELCLDKLHKLAPNFLKLNHLVIQFTSRRLKDADDFLKILPNGPILTSLAITMCRISYEDSTKNMDSSSNFPNLEELRLTGHLILCDEVISAFSKNCPKLLGVSLRESCYVSTAALQNFLKTHNLKKLSLWYLDNFKNDVFSSIRLPHLEMVVVGGMHSFTNEGLRLLMKAAENLVMLRVKSCRKVNFQILINDAVDYTNNRASKHILKLSGGYSFVDAVLPRRVTPRLIILN